jgi:hypothetical protein
MKKRKSFSINKIGFPNINMSNLSKLLEKINYNEESGYGISEIEEVNEILSALLIKRNSTYIQEYNLSEQIFEKKSIYIYSRIKFYIDFEYNLLYTNGPSTNLFQIISLLRNISGLHFDVSSLEVTPYKIYQLLKNKKIKFQLNELTIEKFNFKDGAIGKYTATISIMSIGIELIKLYKEDISKIVFDLNSYKVYFYNNNTMSVVGNIDEIEENFQNFKNIII